MMQQRPARSSVTHIVLVPMLAAAIALFSGCARTVSTSYSPPGELSLDAKPDPGKSPSAQTLFALSRVMDRKDQGEAILLRLIREYPAFMPAYCDLAKLRVDQGRLDGAIEALNLGLEVDSRDPVLHNNLGACYLLKADYGKALDEFSAAADIAPHETRYTTNSALALGMMGRSDAALDLYSQVLTPDYVVHNLGVIEKLTGNAWQTTSEPEPSASIDPEPAAEPPVAAASLELPPAEEEPALTSEPAAETAFAEPPSEIVAPPLEPTVELVALEPPCQAAQPVEVAEEQPECVPEQPEPVVVAVEEPIQAAEPAEVAEAVEPAVEEEVQPEPVVVAVEEPSQAPEPAEVAQAEAEPAVEEVQPEPEVAAIEEPVQAPEPAEVAEAEVEPAVEPAVEQEVQPEPVVVAVEEPSQAAEPAEVAKAEVEPAATTEEETETVVAVLDESPSESAQSDSGEQVATESLEPIPLTPFRPAYSKQSAS